MKPPARLIAELLVNMGHAPAFGGSASWAVYVGNRPDTPNDIIAVFDTSGDVQGKDGEGVVHEHPGIMIHVRAMEYAAGYEKIVAIALALAASVSATVTVDTETYAVGPFTRRAGVIPMGRVDNDRYLWSINITLPTPRAI